MAEKAARWRGRNWRGGDVEDEEGKEAKKAEEHEKHLEQEEGEGEKQTKQEAREEGEKRDKKRGREAVGKEVQNHKRARTEGGGCERDRHQNRAADA